MRPPGRCYGARTSHATPWSCFTRIQLTLLLPFSSAQPQNASSAREAAIGGGKKRCQALGEQRELPAAEEPAPRPLRGSP